MSKRAAPVQKDVPYMPKQHIEEEANLLLAEWCQSHDEIATPPVPIDDIVELHLKLTVEFKDMRQVFPFGDVLGALWMQKHLVGISQDLDPTNHPQKTGRYHFTLAHEGGHWRLHRQYYLENPYQGVLFGDGPRPTTVCRSSQMKKPAERQADYFAAALLMPREMVRVAWRAWHGSLDPVALDDLRASEQEGTDDVVFERFCRPLADEFKVSAEAMRIRLEEMELLVHEKPNLLF